MKVCCYKIFSLLIFLFATFVTYAQPKNIEDTIAQKMYWYALQKPSSLLYVHFDKNIYSNKEYVWFTGYLLKSGAKEDPDAMSVALIRNADRSVLAEGKFAMKDGMSFGNLYIPDSIPAGDYSFVCYTNYLINGNPTDVFNQPVTIKDAYEPGFIANLNLIDSLTPNLDSANVLVKAYSTDITLIKGADVTYFIGDRMNPVKTGKLKTNNFGEATITIPLKGITAANNLLQAEINNGKEMQAFYVKLPVYKKDAIVKFYPEGGNLVNNKMNVVGWEATNNEGEPLQIKAVLYKDDKPVSTLATNAYGMGKFSLKPQDKSRYYIKFAASDQSKDSATYNLPVVINDAPVATILTALVADTLSVQLSAQSGSRWILMVHDYRRQFVASPIITKEGTTAIKVPLNDVPKGINTFTLVDSVGRPWVERIFFAHFDKRNSINIATDSASYGLRQKVEVKFKVTDAQAKPLVGLVSISCAQDNRYEPRKMTDIESYTYLQHELSSLPFRTKWLSNADDNKEYLENLLLVRGWRRYTWQDIVRATANDTLQQQTPLLYTGKVINEGKAVKKMPRVDLLKPPVFNILKVDSLGNFDIPTARLVLRPEQHVRVFVNDPRQDKYIIKVKDPYKEMNRLIVGKLSFNNYITNSFARTNKIEIAHDPERGKRLLDVVVGSKKDGNFAANICGDYVCVANVLNCPNHPFGGSQPVVGVKYRTGRGSLVYEGCEGMKYLDRLDGIYTRKEFYVTDYSNILIDGADKFSTMYWNHNILTNDKGEAKVTFFTNDLPGRFRITMQGITSNTSVAYGEQFFTVRKDQVTQ